MFEFFDVLIAGLRSVNVPIFGFHMTFWDLFVFSFASSAVLVLVRGVYNLWGD